MKTYNNLDELKKQLTGIDICDKQLLRNYDTLDFDLNNRIEGKDWPATALTMVGMKRLENLEVCMDSIVRENISGNLIETGIWRGGVIIFLLALLKHYGIKDRQVFGADSFCGIPKPSGKYKWDKNDTHYTLDPLRVSYETVLQNILEYGFAAESFKLLKGWFHETLPMIDKTTKFSLIRLDGDIYESTIIALENLYDKLSLGGYCIIDDYYCIPQAKLATDHFRQLHNISEPLINVDWTCVYWKKTELKNCQNNVIDQII